MQKSEKELIQKIASAIVDNAIDYARILTFFSCVLVAIDWISSDDSPAIFLIMLIAIFIYPILFLVFSALMMMLKAVSWLFLAFSGYKYRYADDWDDEDSDGDPYWEYTNKQNRSHTYSNHYSNRGPHQEYYNDRSNNGYNEHTYDSKNNYSNRNNQNNKNNSHTYHNNYRNRSDLNVALDYYGLTIPFSEKTLKDKRKELIKRAHPDAGGSEEDAKKINVYYDILKHYIS